MIGKVKVLFLFSFFSTSLVVTAVSQEDFKTLFDKATTQMVDENFHAALPYLIKLGEIDPGNSNIHFMKGVCYLNPPVIQSNKAVTELKIATSNMTKDYIIGDFKEKKAPYYSLMFLGDAYHLNYQFEEAIATYKRIKRDIALEDKEALRELNRKIDISNNAILYRKAPLNMTIKNIGKNINSPEQEYFASVNADESMLIFTSKREGNLGGIDNFTGNYYEDIFYAKKDADGNWDKPLNMGSPVNTDGHDASISFSADGQSLWLYRFTTEDGGDIYKSVLVEDKWVEPVKLGSNINTEYWEGSVTTSVDGNRLYFSSNRPGGFGGRDIYFCNKLPNGKWALAQNAGAVINTEYDDNAPLMHPDGYTMFFSSKGHNTMGGYDIFYSEMNDQGKLTTPVNIGYPVNTPGDDLHFHPTVNRKRAYYSSYREDGFGKQDIYVINFPDVTPTPLTVYKGLATDKDGNVPDDIFITVTDTETGELYGNYIPNAKTGKYIIILNPGKNYTIDYENNDGIMYSDQLDVPTNSAYQIIERAIDLDPIDYEKGKEDEFQETEEGEGNE